jgi:hypothetical protein
VKGLKIVEVFPMLGELADVQQVLQVPLSSTFRGRNNGTKVTHRSCLRAMTALTVLTHTFLWREVQRQI